MPTLHAIFELCGAVLLFFTLPLSLELGVLSLAALFPLRRVSKQHDGRQIRLFVLIPAHNEEKLIGPCIESILSGSDASMRVLVVAHNCTDNTAEVGSATGATVLALHKGAGGKGAALHFGFTEALRAGADAVLVIDADSFVSGNLSAKVLAAFAGGAQAVQCRYEVANPSVNRRTRLLALSFLGINVLRPRGRARLGLSCGIFGNGFALSAETLQRVPYVANSIVEDLEYHLHLLRAGIRVDFLDDATVSGEMPDSNTASATQRARWEGGRLRMRRQFSWALLREVLRGRLAMLEPLADLRALPLATQAGFLLVALLLPVPWLRLYATASIAAMLLYVVVAASLGSAPGEMLKALAAVPGYMLWKLAMLPRTRLAARKDAAWVRTKRNDP